MNIEFYQIRNDHPVSFRKNKDSYCFNYIRFYLRVKTCKEDAPFSSDKDEASFFKPIIEVDYGFLSDKFTDHLPLTTTKYYDYTLPHRLSTSSSSSITTSEEDLKSEQPQRLLIQKENKYSYLLQHPPLKKTPIGPQYQAEIPECYELNPQHNDNEIKFIGSCVIQMPNSSSSHYELLEEEEPIVSVKTPGP
ncbi:unnamed protein product [Lactuca saligna]|uniref:ELM2 domain-containing protein n=1 Tax=Lactuca saligna TaxID=75948 RepID=A0AA36E4L5_LACSI|nr:unnamed protein product [Lactuca saligna]